ncbi:hypothetical protein ASD65_14840 [Microbacterium sp. Root61]|uniref:DUF5979 domain-containing protein n=1 Tax=Microbacterium sp. Root61 TaxID=1736570 RepID=UPI0006FF2BF7|nr:DUF5979 domain-containing protein [Microbacterium sp. Root61]KRA25549.1 hypothetical protein ASD65_14840 [Microbacterium sp. Root61]
MLKFGTLYRAVAAVTGATLVAAMVTAGALPAPAVEVPQSTLAVSKSDNLGGQTLKPGADFVYELTASCSNIEVDCTDVVLTDVLPEGIDITALPQSTPDRTVEFVEATRTLTISFHKKTDNPAGVGLPAGSQEVFEVAGRLPANTPMLSGDKITNVAELSGSNAATVTDDDIIVVEVPKAVTPIATKSWTEGTSVAGTNNVVEVKLGVRNGSSSSAAVTTLSVVDDTAATYEHFDATSVSVTTFPKGANKAVLQAKIGGNWMSVSTLSAAGTFPGAPGVDLAFATGIRIDFTDVDDKILPYDADGGAATLTLELRDTLRSTGAPIAPTAKIPVDNCAVPVAAEATGAPVQGAAACSVHQILPDTLVLESKKSFFADRDGNFTRNTGEYAVIGEHSPVSATVSVQNKSPFPVSELTITEPDTTVAGQEFSFVDVSKIRLTFPVGSSNAQVTYTFANGEVRTVDYDPRAGGTDLAIADLQVSSALTKVSVKYTGNGAAIIEGATAGLGVHGTLNDKVTDADLPGGTSPGVFNCAATAGSAGRTDGTGVAVGQACATLPVESPRQTTGGTKTVSQNSIPEGQPIVFTLKVVNNGNLDLVTPSITDPRVNAVDAPVSAGNPFASLRLVSAGITRQGSPDADIQVYDPTAAKWVPYAAGNAALLERATGVRAVAQGSLAPTQGFTLTLVTERRAGIPDDAVIANCFVTSSSTAGYVPGDPSCSPEIVTGPQSADVNLNKMISPGLLPVFVPGLPAQKADVSLMVSNTGNLSAKRLQITDADADFFDAVDFIKVAKVTFPAGANRVTFDYLVGSTWHTTGPLASAGSYPLPSGVDADEVVGIRATFSSTSSANDGYVITPCAIGNDACKGVISYTISPREALRKSGDVAKLGVLTNTATAGYETRLQAPGTLAEIAEVDATLELVTGTTQLDVDKTPDTTLTPGAKTSFFLKVTNTGTGNIPGLTVRDLIPAGMAFVEDFAGDTVGGVVQPYKIVDATIPSGAKAIPVPEFTVARDGERVSGLSWDFGSDWLFAPGARFTIEIQVALEPGVTAGQKLTNTMAAGSTVVPPTQFTCKRPGSTSTDGPFGPGVVCTDTAQLSVSAGAAFDTRKWVAGTPELGWYNATTKENIPTGDVSCPVMVRGGVSYTATPCIALVHPGENFSYVLRTINAGTEDASRVVIADRFPVHGDTAILSDQKRGTEWNSAPTLIGVPAVDVPGTATVTTGFSHGKTLCTADLDMRTPAVCDVDDWTADAAGASGFQTSVDFPQGARLKPGQGFDIAFQMASPADVKRVSDPTIAWNSIARGAETIRSNGTVRPLAPLEPIKVGVGLSFGAFQVTKTITSNPGGLPLDGLEYGFAYSCSMDVNGTIEVVRDGTGAVAVGTPTTVSGIPSNAVCDVWETDAHGAVASHPEADPITLDPIVAHFGTGEPDPASVRTAALTNDFPLASVPVTKVVDGGAADFADGPYTVELSCTFEGTPVTGSPFTVTLTEPGTKNVQVPVGSTCSARETAQGSATHVVVSPAQLQVGAASTGFTVTNTFVAGSLVIGKELVGTGANLATGTEFDFSVSCSFDGRDDVYTGSVTLTADGTSTLRSDPITPLPIGAECLVTETDNGGADATPAPVQVVITENADANTVVAGFTNAFSAGSLEVAKVLDGPAAGEDYATDAEYELLVTCQRPDADDELTTVFGGTVVVRAGDTIPVLHPVSGEPVLLPVGTHCFAEETGTGLATSWEIDHDSYDTATIVTAGDPDEIQALTITATNTFEYGEVVVDKRIGTNPDSLALDATEFPVAYRCEIPNDETGWLVEGTGVISVNGALRLEQLAHTARCLVWETETGGARSSHTADNPLELVVDTTDAEIAQGEIVNDFAAGVRPDLPATGGSLPWLVLGAAGVLLLAGALVLYLGRRTRRS